jgi:hypothetical protein
VSILEAILWIAVTPFTIWGWLEFMEWIAEDVQPSTEDGGKPLKERGH